MAYDPCLSVSDPGGPAHVVHHHHAVHRVIGRISHRIHKAQYHAVPPAPIPSDACGKRIPHPAAAKAPLAALPKTAALGGIGAASVLGATGVVGATHGFSPPGNPGGPTGQFPPPPVTTTPPVVIPPPVVMVPEPSSIALFLVAAAVALYVRRRYMASHA